MKRFLLILGLSIFLFIGIASPYSFSAVDYKFTANTNVYKTQSHWTHADNSLEHFDFTYTYYKLPHKIKFEMTSDRGQHGIVEAEAFVDPMLYDTACTGSAKIVKHCPLLDWEPEFKNPCGKPVVYQVMGSDAQRAAVLQEYEAAKQAHLQHPPVIISPEPNSSQFSTDKVTVELGLKLVPVTPCKHWTFTVVFDRWDESAGSNGKWTSGPHSYTAFKGYDHEEGGHIYCRAKYYFDFKPGKYRFRARARNADGRQPGWSPWSEFSVKLKPTANIPTGLNITSPKKGESFFIGDQIHIRWTSFGIDQRIKIGLLQGGNIIPITTAQGVENTGYWRWTIPSSVKPGTYRLGIATLNNSHNDVVDDIGIKMKFKKR